MKRWMKCAFALLLSMACAGFLPLLGMAAGPNGLSDGLEAYWNLDEGSGSTAKELSGKVAGRDLKVVGKTQWVDGIQGKAFYLDGFTVLSMDGNQRIRSLDLSISLWAKIEGFPNPGDEKPEFDAHKLMTIEGIGGLTPGSVEFGFWDGKPDASIIVDKKMNKEQVLGEEAIAMDGKWHQYGLVIDDAAEVMKYYIDGQVVKEQKLNRSLGLPKLLSVPEDKGYYGNLNIGGYVGMDGSEVSRGIKGAIDEIAIYSKALSDSDMKKLASSEGVAPPPSVPTESKPGPTNSSASPTTSQATTAGDKPGTTVGETGTTVSGNSSSTPGSTASTAAGTLATTSSSAVSTQGAMATIGENTEKKSNSWILPGVIIGTIIVVLGGGAAVGYLIMRKKKTPGK